MFIIVLLFSVLFLAWSNGSNDNFKGVATLYGSGTLSYRSAIMLATVATFAGSICAIFLANGLVEAFSGKGLVPKDIAGSIDFLIAVGLGAGMTVLVATRLGYPISTTHSLVGGLLGAGLMAVGFDVHISVLGKVFLFPLFASPFIAFSLGAAVYWFFTTVRKSINLTKESCFCVGEKRKWVPIRPLIGSPAEKTPHNIPFNEFRHSLLEASINNTAECEEMYTDQLWSISLQKLLDTAHIISAGVVSFARGLNDTPKIAGLLFVLGSSNMDSSMVAIAIAIAIGGLLNARRVAETMSKKITDLNHGQGFSANLVTGFLVIVASNFGVPVSTTHVSVGSIFGIGMVSGKRNIKVIRTILLSWLFTLPVAMLLSAIVYLLLS